VIVYYMVWRCRNRENINAVFAPVGPFYEVVFLMKEGAGAPGAAPGAGCS